MAQVALHTPIPLSTNMCVTEFEHIPVAFRQRAVQVVLGDHHSWGGLTATRHLGVVCKTLGWGLSQHSNSHLGISFAAMVHAGAAIPNLLHASDTHYPWNSAPDIVNETDLLRFRDGAIELWDAPGLGVTINEEALTAAADAYTRLDAGSIETMSARCGNATRTGCHTFPSGEPGEFPARRRAPEDA